MESDETEGSGVFSHGSHIHAGRIQPEDDDEDRAIYTPATRMHSAPLHIPQPPPSLAEQLKQVR